MSQMSSSGFLADDFPEDFLFDVALTSNDSKSSSTGVVGATFIERDLLLGALDAFDPELCDSKPFHPSSLPPEEF